MSWISSADGERPSPLISIIICSHGRPAELQATLASLAQQHFALSWSVELCVVENGAPSGADAIARSFQHSHIRALYLHEPVANKSNALNRAVAEAKGEILLFTDDDVRFPPGWITAMCTPLLEGRGSVVVGGCSIAPHLQRRWMTRYHRSFLASTEHLSRDNPSEFAGVNMACLRRLFGLGFAFDCALGGGGLGNGEDTLLALQWKQAGVRFISRTDLCVEHHFTPARLTRASWLAAARDRGRSRAYIELHSRHACPRLSWVTLLYFAAKLYVRLIAARFGRSAGPAPAWELSYRVDLARLQYLRAHHSDLFRNDPPLSAGLSTPSAAFTKLNA